MMNTIETLVADILKERSYTLRGVAEALGVSHPTVINWRDGRSVPEGDFLISTALEFDDWRRDFAVRCLIVRWPEGRVAWEVLGDGGL